MIVQTFINKKILVGVCGGIAAYKSVELVRRLTKQGAQVRVVMTASAQEFVTPLTFQAVSGHPVHSSLLDPAAEAAMGHIELARWADMILIAPATADTLARLRAGFADDLLTTLCVASEAPLCLAPAMNSVMWYKQSTQDNCQVLESRGCVLLGPGDGAQACGEFGLGRMLEPEQIVLALSEQFVSKPGFLNGLKVMVTAGPTFEDIDPVRYLGNRSSGKMGLAVAKAAQMAGAEVCLICGPIQICGPDGVNRINVRTAAQMQQKVTENITGCDIFIAAAAVADFRAACCQEKKIKKGQSQSLTLELERNPDILAGVAALPDGPFTVGFAAETDRVEEYALGKLERKKLNMIAANRVGVGQCGFEADDNALTVLWQKGRAELGPGLKSELAVQLLELVAQRYQEKGESV